MIAATLYQKFKNVADPQKYFKKHFIAAAFSGFVAAYGTAGYLAYDIYRQETKTNKEFSLYDVFSWDTVKKHGLKGAAAYGIGYIGDIGFVYGLAGMAYQRSRRRKDAQQPKPSEN